MITVESLVILSPTNLDFENNGVINPGIYQDGNTVHILYRAVQEGNNSTICKKMKGPKIVERLKSLYRATSIMKKGLKTESGQN
jgi:hypothetical protein